MQKTSLAICGGGKVTREKYFIIYIYIFLSSFMQMSPSNHTTLYLQRDESYLLKHYLNNKYLFIFPKIILLKYTDKSRCTQIEFYNIIFINYICIYLDKYVWVDIQYILYIFISIYYIRTPKEESLVYILQMKNSSLYIFPKNFFSYVHIFYNFKTIWVVSRL